MKIFTLTLKSLILTVGFIPFVVSEASESSSVYDPIFHPATLSPIASRSQLTAITRAGNRLITVGWRGHILYSDDGGNHWTQADVPVSVDLTAVFFPTAEQGWAVGHGGVILHSNDAGKHWIKQEDGYNIGSKMLEYYRNIALPALDKDFFLQQINLDYENGPEQPWLSVWFENNSHGYVSGSFNLIMETRDGGNTWTPILERTDNPDSLNLEAIHQIGKNIYIASERGNIFQLNRQSQRFEIVNTGYVGSFFGLVGNDNILLAFGLRGKLFRKQEGMRSWEEIHNKDIANFSAATSLPDGRFVFVTIGGQVLVSNADATKIRSVPVGTPSPFSGVVAVDNQTVVAVGTNGPQIITIRTME